MITSGGRFRTFGQLSRALLADPAWPSDTKIQERSLGALVSKLDRDLELDWLSDRPDVQALLARMLQCSVRELHLSAPPTDPEGSSQKLRWNDLRLARTFDLGTEGLPPGIPVEVSDPLLWERTWWVAPSGSGRSLVGHWLRARALAQFVCAGSVDELSVALEAEAPRFVEITSLTEIQVEPPADPRVCVACAVPPSPCVGWHIVQSPPLETYLPALVRWILERMPKDSWLDETTLFDWLTAGPAQTGEADGLGAVVGLCGALDELGPKESRGKTVLELARQSVRRRFDEGFGLQARDVAWQRKHAVDVLIAMARRALTDDVLPFGSARTLEEWTALVPEEHKSGVDVEWLRVSLPRIDSTIRPTDVERAARKLSPGAFRIVRSLSTAGLLRPTRDQRLEPGPRWLTRAVELEAERSLLDGSPFEWGEALLMPHAAARVAKRLSERLGARDTTLLGDVVELEAAESPAYAVAIETTFRAAGLALLAGAELNHEQLEDLWDSASDLWLRLRDGAPVPRIEHPPRLGSLFERGAFYLAALAVSEALGARASEHEKLLSPWRGQGIPAGLASVYAEIHTAVERALSEGAAWVGGAYALIDRLRRTLGSVAVGAPHPLELPGVLLDGVHSGELRWEAVQLSAAHADVLLTLWRARGETNAHALGTSLFSAWERADCPDLEGSVLCPSTDAGCVLFRSAPAELALRAIEISKTSRARLVPLLSSEAWERCAQDPPEDASLLDLLANVLPEAPAQLWLDHPRLAPRVWRRHAKAALGRALRESTEGNLIAFLRLASEAPPQHMGALFAALAAHEHPSASEREPLRNWLHERIASRLPGWRQAYAILARIEA